jgi:hypothetical protein
MQQRVTCHSVAPLVNPEAHQHRHYHGTSPSLAFLPSLAHVVCTLALPSHSPTPFPRSSAATARVCLLPAQSDWDPDVGFNDEAQAAEASQPPEKRVMRVSAIPGTYALEYTFVGFCAVFGLVFLWGRRANARIAEAWYVLGCVDLRCSVKWCSGDLGGHEVFTCRNG